MVFKTRFEFSKYTFWFFSPPPYFKILLLFWSFCFLSPGKFRSKPQIFPIKFLQGSNSTLRKEGEKAKKPQQLKCPVKAMKSHARKKKIKKLGLSKGNIPPAIWRFAPKNPPAISALTTTAFWAGVFFFYFSQAAVLAAHEPRSNALNPSPGSCAVGRCSPEPTSPFRATIMLSPPR